MANSRSLLVYVLSLVVVVCGRSWVSANTIPIVVKDHLPVSSGGPSSPKSQHQPHQQPTYYQTPHKLPQDQLQATKPEKLPASSSPSSAPPALPPPSIPQHTLPKSFSVKNAWGLSAGNSDSGPYTTGYGYWGVGTGRNLEDPSTSYMTDVDLPENVKIATPQTAMNNLANPQMNVDSLNTITSSVSPLGHSAVDGFGTLISGLFGMFAGYAAGTGRLSRVYPFVRGYFFPDPQPEVKNNTIILTNSTSTRTKRAVDVIQRNDDLSELAGIVLSAIHSGECMQRSICLIGSRIGNSDKGKVAFGLVDKLIPESVQTNQYFVTMKKALKGGESFCDRFHCRFN